MIKGNYIFPVKVAEGNKPRHHPFIAFDVENDPDTADFICASLYGEYKDHHGRLHRVREYFEDRFKLMERIKQIANSGGRKNNPFNLVGFNVDYDLHYIRELVDDATRLSVGSRLITARLKCGTYDKDSKKRTGIKVYDATNYVRGSLEDWIKVLKMEEQGVRKLPLSQLKERNLMDSKATWILINWIEDTMVNEFKIPLQLTIGSCSLYFFRKHFLKHTIKRNNQFLNDYERKAYRGGRVEVFKRGKHFVRSYDVNSMYLSILHDEEFPDPQSAAYHKGECDITDGKFRIVHAKVTVPQQIVAPLPYYDKEKHKLLFPCGTFEGYFVSVELANALKYDVKILEIFDYVEYARKEKYFKDFAAFVWIARQQHKGQGDSNLDYMYKTIGNSLYGKFGEQRKEGGWIRLSDYEGSTEGLLMKVYQGDEYVYTKPTEPAYDSIHTFPCIPAFVTAYGRIKLLNKLKEDEENAVYSDTDSVKLENQKGKPTDSKELGGWGYEYDEEQVFYRPKLYGTKRKGIPKRAELIAVGEENEYYTYKKPLKRNEAIRMEDTQNRWITIMKKVLLTDDKRVWFKDGNSLPITIS